MDDIEKKWKALTFESEIPGLVASQDYADLSEVFIITLQQLRDIFLKTEPGLFYSDMASLPL